MSEIVGTCEALAEAMQRDGVPVDCPAGSDRILFPAVDSGLDTTAVLIWPAQVALLQLMLPLRFAIVPAHRAALCEAVVRLNHALVLPGFGVDVARGLVYFRGVLAREPDGSVGVDAVRRMVQASISTAARFGTVLAQVADGSLQPEDVETALG